MTGAQRYEVASSELVYDTIEGEVIILNLETGTYYQLMQTAVPVWNWLVTGHTVAEIEAQLFEKFPDAAAIPQSVDAFLNQVLTENLLQPLPDDSSAPTAPSTFTMPPTVTDAFVPPNLLKYTDMQSLLLLDPVHDIDADGWPILKPNTLAV